MTHFPVTSFLLLFSMFALTTSTTPPTPPPAPGGCSDAVIAISPCLPFISDPPNNLSSRPSSQCCDLFATSFKAGEAVCLCYLVRGDRLLGFPVNTTKLLSLSSLCHLMDTRSNATSSLQSICTGAKKLPPLLSTTGPVISKAHDSGSDIPSSPSTTKTPDSANSSSRQPSSLPMPAADSSTSQEINSNGNQFLPGIMILIVPILYFLQPVIATFLSCTHF